MRLLRYFLKMPKLGSVIRPNWTTDVLAARHCVRVPTLQPIMLRLGFSAPSMLTIDTAFSDPNLNFQLYRATHFGLRHFKSGIHFP